MPHIPLSLVEQVTVQHAALEVDLSPMHDPNNQIDKYWLRLLLNPEYVHPQPVPHSGELPARQAIESDSVL
jgi:hypothetical protein